MDLFVVHFGKSGARIVKGREAERMALDPNALVNPIIPRGVPPHLWQREGNKIVASVQAVSPKQTRLRRFHRKSLTSGIVIGSIAGTAVGAALTALMMHAF